MLESIFKRDIEDRILKYCTTSEEQNAAFNGIMLGYAVISEFIQSGEFEGPEGLLKHGLKHAHPYTVKACNVILSTYEENKRFVLYLQENIFDNYDVNKPSPYRRR